MPVPNNGGTSVVHVVAWAREVIVYSCARSIGNQVVVGKWREMNE